MAEDRASVRGEPRSELVVQDFGIRRTVAARLAALGVVGALLVGACGGGTAASSSAPSSVAPSATPAASSAAPSENASASAGVDDQAEWDALVEAAKKEGELVVMFGSGTVVAEQKWRDEFTKEFGIKIEAVAGSTGEITDRVLAERSQGQYTVDIAGQGPSGMIRLSEAKVLTPLEPLLLPRALEPSAWYDDWIPWSTEDLDCHCLIYYSMDVNPNILRTYYNTEKVTADEVSSVGEWNDFLDPKWKGRMAIYDITEGAAGSRTEGWIKLGEDYWDKFMRTQDVKVMPYGQDQLFADTLARGEFDLTPFPGTAQGQILENQENGLPVDEWPNTLKEGPAAEYQRHMAIMDKAPHPNAAKLFVNWAMSKEGGELYNQLDEAPYVHMRKDVGQGIVPDSTWQRVQSLTEIQDLNTPEYRAANDESLAWWNAIFDELNLRPAG